jgi:hypothetical protein
MFLGSVEWMELTQACRRRTVGIVTVLQTLGRMPHLDDASNRLVEQEV